MQRLRVNGPHYRGTVQIFAAPFLLASLLATPAAAATLMVGPDQTYKVPSQAAAVAQPGDTIIITPSTYHDCAVWTADNITIEASANGVLLSKTVCQNKAIFVIPANNVTVSGITFSGAVSTDGNGAGIRSEGANLTVNNSTFSYNQEGILSANNAQSTITITNSQFIHNGTCSSKEGCAHGIYIGSIALLQVENTKFYNTQQGHHIKSLAATTEITDCDIEDGPTGTASYEVDIPYGGNLEISNTIMEKGPKSQNHTTAISIGEGNESQVTNQILVESNTFTNDGPPTVFVTNDTSTSAQLTNNTLLGNPTTALKGDGTVN
jgi:hypothetical protein